ncbi:MAG: Lacal_2735 family protein [Algoriphagus sp.]|uniref:Lacal_2735 family protein n=1 Tax=Algoriphagus sp. TaxID=1872435 RepID=UPI001820AF80|nr:Lacal_2735 family protein [Algoriphagus sp.]NVJ85303.1 Lacal_2735 family protein [Algoriphagus sp.]
MFNLFKKKTEAEKLQELYKKTLEKAHKLSHSNRAESDKLMAEAEEIAKKIEKIQ